MSSPASNSWLPPDEERLINTIVDLGLRELKPRRTDHTIVYAGLEELTKELGVKETRKLLRSLANKGFLEEKNYDSAISCPNCESNIVHSKYSCPQCESKNVHKIQLIEHPFCGYIGNRDEFEPDGELTCPKCKTKLGSFAKAQSKNQTDKSKVIRVIGSSYSCDKCGSKFEKPNITHICDRCDATFTYKEANYDKLPLYELTEKVDSLAPRRFVMDAMTNLQKLLLGKGYTVERDAKIRGKSGIEQSFSLAARMDKRTVLIDISPWGNQNDLITLLGKKTDVDGKSIILLDLAGNPDLAPMGKPYGIAVVNGKDEKYLEQLSGLLDAEKKEDEKRGSALWRRR